MTVQLGYINHSLQFKKIISFPIMPALYLLLSVTCCAQNYAGIIGWSLHFSIIKPNSLSHIISKLCFKLVISDYVYCIAGKYGRGEFGEFGKSSVFC